MIIVAEPFPCADCGKPVVYLWGIYADADHDVEGKAFDDLIEHECEEGEE